MQKTAFTRGGRAFFLLRLFYFVLLVAAADFAAGKLLGFFYARQRSGNEFATRFAAEETKADMVILGASRAQQQYIPTCFEDSLKLTCFNAGRDGTPFFYHYAMLQAILKRYTPKVVVLDCEYMLLKQSALSYDRLSCLLPLYRSHPEMRSVINLKSDLEKYKLISAIYPYNSMVFKIAVGNIKKLDSSQFINGYVPLFEELSQPIKTYDCTQPYELDTIKTSMLRSFVDECNKKNIKLFFVCPPYYMKTIGTDYSLAVTKQIAKETNTAFFDYSQDTAYQSKPYLFEDTVHLNHTGAKIFCEALASKLKREINKTP